ncbi:MAG TPA: GMC family oxidoreductase [Acidimicrobiales bacterium]|nr:GMC family oxidoreductase [Acidimicrobiales bacterium]
MIEDATQLPVSALLEGDVCIIGGGAAGITLALELIPSDLKVILLTGGAEKETSADRDLYRGHATPTDSHEPLEENRRRVFGGTTTAWGGRCVPYDAVDFAERPWLYESGWPIGIQTIAPYLDRANQLCEAGACTYDARDLDGAPPEMITGFDDEILTSTRLERWSPPTKFSAKYRPALAAATNVSVLLNAHALELTTTDDGSAIAAIRAASAPGREFTVRCHRYVVACGGLENARLLLVSNAKNHAGVGNEHDNVGRYYMSHLFGTHAYAEIEIDSEHFRYDFERDPEGVYYRRRFWLSEAAQAERRVGNAIAYFSRPPSDGDHAIHQDPLFSATYLGRYYIRVFNRYGLIGACREIRRDKASLRRHWRTLIVGAPRFTPTALRLIRARFLGDRRLPMVLAPKSSRRHYLYYQTEHLPDRESRLVLHADRDAFAMPRLDARVRFGQRDIDTVLALHRAVGRRFVELGAGRLIYREEELEAEVRAGIASFNSNAHHLGTTRMSDDPRRGVVDANCKVHSVDNVYVAGSSVFATSSHANPTLLLVALAIRLAEHLRQAAPNPETPRRERP